MENVLSRFGSARFTRKSLLARVVDMLLCMDAAHKHARRIETMDDHLLRDVGLTRDQLRTDSKAVWDAPIQLRSLN